MPNITRNKLRRIIYSAVELRDTHPDWTDAMIEDYLNLFDNELTLSDSIDTIMPSNTNAAARSYFYGRTY